MYSDMVCAALFIKKGLTLVLNNYWNITVRKVAYL